MNERSTHCPLDSVVANPQPLTLSQKSSVGNCNGFKLQTDLKGLNSLLWFCDRPHRTGYPLSTYTITHRSSDYTIWVSTAGDRLPPHLPSIIYRPRPQHKRIHVPLCSELESGLKVKLCVIALQFPPYYLGATLSSSAVRPSPARSHFQAIRMTSLHPSHGEWPFDSCKDPSVSSCQLRALFLLVF